MLPFSFIEQTAHEGSSDWYIYFEDRDENEAEASWCSGKISYRGSEGWKRDKGRGRILSLGETVGELVGTEGVVGGADGPGSGTKCRFELGCEEGYLNREMKGKRWAEYTRQEGV